MEEHTVSVFCNAGILASIGIEKRTHLLVEERLHLITYYKTLSVSIGIEERTHPIALSVHLLTWSYWRLLVLRNAHF